jgi:limonene-1,2-epoxide hydrolase
LPPTAGRSLTERVDVFRLPGKEISPPIMGTFEVIDGKIPARQRGRDYFDMNRFMSQLSA